LTYSGGTLLGTSTTTIWQYTSTHDQIFEATSQDGDCDWLSTSVPFPTSATLGQSGTYAQFTSYVSCTTPDQVRFATQQWGTMAETWSYSQIDGGAFLCLISAFTAAGVTTTDQDCFEIVDTSGTLGTRVRVTNTDADGVVTTLKNY